MSREEATRAARRRFGNVALLEERGREVWQWPTIDSIWADVRFALRQLRRSPGFTIVSLLTLALGIGANTAVYSIIQAVLLHPLPYHDPNRLMLLADKQDPQEGGVLYKDYEMWRKHTSSFTGIAAYYRDSGWSRVTLTGGHEPQSFQGAYVTANFFSLLGVAPLLGRTFTTAEENRHERVIVLSHGLWKRQFGGSPDVVGQDLHIDGIASKVIGVMPESFQFPAADSRFWAPITANRYWGDPAVTINDGFHGRGFYARWQVIARLKGRSQPAAGAGRYRCNRQRFAKDRFRPEPGHRDYCDPASHSARREYTACPLCSFRISVHAALNRLQQCDQSCAGTQRIARP